MSTENNLESKTKKITNCLYVYMFIVHNNTIQYNTIQYNTCIYIYFKTLQIIMKILI